MPTPPPTKGTTTIPLLGNRLRVAGFLPWGHVIGNWESWTGCWIRC